jgi:signal peptidase II
MNPILKRAAMVTAAVVIADQALKIWVKTHLFIGEGSYTNWGVGISQLQLKFVEDPAMPIALSIFRLLAIGGIVYYMIWAVKNRNPHKGFITCLSMILAGVIGNMIDCMFYGIIFSQSGNSAEMIAEIFPATGGYATFLQGKVVDMLQFPILSSIYNIADVAITAGLVLIAIFWKRYFPKNEKS